MKNLSIYLFSVLLGLLSACNSPKNNEVKGVDTTVKSATSTPSLSPDVSYGLEAYNNLLNSFKQFPDSSGSPITYPAYYGGAYVKNRKLVILIADNPTQYREEFVERCGSINITVEKCQYSYATLLEQMDRISELKKNGKVQNIMGFGIKDDKNMIGIQMKELNDNTIKELLNLVGPSNMFYFTQGEEIRLE